LTNVQIESSLPINLLDLDEPISISTDPELALRFFNNFFQALDLLERAEHVTISSPKPESDAERKPYIKIRIQGFPTEITGKIFLREFSNKISGPLKQSLALAECAQLSDRLGWTVFLYSNVNNELLMNLYF